MERETRRTVVNIPSDQPGFDFEQAARLPPFTFPEYQRDLLRDRAQAGLIDFSLVGAVYTGFVALCWAYLPADYTLDKRMFGVFGAGFLILAGVYFFLFMIGSSQTPGMRIRSLTVVNVSGEPLQAGPAMLRGFGYFISIIPGMLGFVWALVDPEHTTWADKVSGTYVRRVV